VQLARWVCDLPGEFCRFLTGPKNNFCKSGHLPRSLAQSLRSVSGKGENHHHPPTKGSEKMGVTPRFNSPGQFDRYCKLVLEHEAIDYLRKMDSLHDRQMSLSILPQKEMDKLSTVDSYPSESHIFTSHGCDLPIENELVADAFAGLTEQEQSILILH
jgi:hypothetical protein